MRWRQREGAERFAERRRREDEAPRLSTTFPRLETLRLQIAEHRAGSAVPEATHTRPVVVASAPALFVFPCLDPSCKDGGHDVTHEILAALKNVKEEFAGEDPCRGATGSAECSRILKYVAKATYSK